MSQITVCLGPLTQQGATRRTAPILPSPRTCPALLCPVPGQGHTEAETATIMLQVLQAIRCCHEDHSICHRDLKPENFLLKNRDDLSQLRMIDFGLSRYFEKGERLVTRVGTIYYTAPEVWSEDYDKTCDLWSAGVIMYVYVACDAAGL